MAYGHQIAHGKNSLLDAASRAGVHRQVNVDGRCSSEQGRLHGLGKQIATSLSSKHQYMTIAGPADLRNAHNSLASERGSL